MPEPHILSPICRFTVRLMFLVITKLFGGRRAPLACHGDTAEKLGGRYSSLRFPLPKYQKSTYASPFMLLRKVR